jgi:stage V sporulation protein R
MKTVMEIVRRTSLYFQPQIRTKILNEGWASYWHEKLFLSDDRIRGNEVNYARVNAGVTSMPRVGINPYALGMRLFQYLEEMADKGRISYEYQRLSDSHQRREFDRHTGEGLAFVFNVRENFNDFTLIHTFVDQDFINRNRLFVAGRRLNSQRGVWEYFVKSRKAEDYRKMLLDTLYHPPFIRVDEEKTKDGILYLRHAYEGKPLVRDYIANTMLGIEYLWGGTVQMETTEAEQEMPSGFDDIQPFFMPTTTVDEPEKKKVTLRQVVYTMEKKKLTRTVT